MSGHKGLDKWFKQDWVDIGSKKKGGGHKMAGGFSIETKNIDKFFTRAIFINFSFY